MFNTYLDLKPHLNDFIQRISQKSEIIFLGGSVRDIISDTIPRDLDIVVVEDIDISKFLPSYTRNIFDGYKTNIDDVDVDIWNLNSTWAIKNNHASKLIDTPFINLDAVTYNYNIGVFEGLSDFFYTTKISKKLDFKCYITPFIEINFIKACILCERYNITFSQRLSARFGMEIYVTSTNIKDLAKWLYAKHLEIYGTPRILETKIYQYLKLLM